MEGKHHKLSRSLRSGLTDKDLKPNAATRDQLNVRGPECYCIFFNILFRYDIWFYNVSMGCTYERLQDA